MFKNNCITLVLAKYGTENDLISLIQSSKSIWTQSSWTARQIASITPILSLAHQVLIKDTIVKHGLSQALQVLSHIDNLKQLTTLDQQLNRYLKDKPSVNNSYYPLPKIILTIAILQGKLNISEKKNLSQNLLSIITDPRYRYLINIYK